MIVPKSAFNLWGLDGDVDEIQRITIVLSGANNCYQMDWGIMRNVFEGNSLLVACVWQNTRVLELSYSKLGGR